jgi:hypothetical protein
MEDMESTDETLKPFATKLLKSFDFTKGSRFAAHRRLLKKHHLSTLSVSMLSLYVIAASLMPVFLGPLPGKSNSVLAFATIIASIFIIVLSHVAAAQNYYVRAERMLKCAQKISELSYELEQRVSSSSLNEAFIEKTRNLYAAILNDYSENHDDVDFLYYSKNFSTVDAPTEFGGKLLRYFQGRYYALLYYCNILLFHFLLIAIPPVLIVAAFLGRTEWLIK